MCSRVSSDRVEAAWCVVVIAVVIAGGCGALWRLEAMQEKRNSHDL